MKMRHMHNRILISLKEKGKYEIFRKIGYRNVLVDEVTQSQNNKCHMFSLICESLL